MPRMRIHELAKQVNRSSKDIIEVCNKKNIEVQSHMSTLTEEQVDELTKVFAPKQERSVPEKEESSKNIKSDDSKKPNIIQVYNPQNSRVNKNVKSSNTTTQARTFNSNQTQQNTVKQQHSEQTAQKPQNSQGGYQQRPQGEQGGYRERPQNSQGGYQQRPQGEQGGYRERPQNSQGGYQQRPQGEQGGYRERPQNSQGGYQQRTNDQNGYRQRPQGSQGGYQQRTQNGEGGYQQRTQNGEGGYQQRPQGSYQQRPQGSYQQRSNGEGGYQQRSQGSYQQRPQGSYQQRSNGEGGYQQRPQNGQSGYQQRPQNGQGGYQQRPQNGQGGYQQRPQNGQGGYQQRNQNGEGGYQQRNQNGEGGYQQRYSNNQNGYQRNQGGGNNAGARQGNDRGNYQQSQGRGKSNDMFQVLTETAKPVKESRKSTIDNRKLNKGEKEFEQSKKFVDDTVKVEGIIKGGKGKQKPNQGKMQGTVVVKEAPVQEEVIKTITIPETLTIKELAEKMKMQPSAIVKKLFLQGIMVTVNQEIPFEKAEEIAIEYEVICEHEVVVDVIEELLKEDEEAEDAMKARPPVVCVMGHVDHGKTSLLDAIRKTNVIAKEAGGITQHIGAYVVTINGKKITFLDTPGHEAFTAMRMRGANSTDIAILVVAADDGVMPQTIEAINHAKAAGIEIIIAVNKIDKPSANIDRVKQELAEYELIPEDWGGSTIFVPVSAKTGEGIEQLLEMILLTAEIGELKANPERRARGLVIEAELDKGRGPVATVLVQKGTLRVGDSIAAGSCYGKVRAMIDDMGRRVQEAGPSTPVEILGLNDVPNAGDIFISPETEKEARNFAETFISQGRVKLLEDTKAKMSLDDLFTRIKEDNLKELDIIVKADVQGSVEAVKQSLLKLSNEEVVVKIIHGGVGAINESDVILASASNAIIIGFNVRPDSTAKTTAEREGVDVRLYRVIYQAIEDVAAAMKGMLDPIFEEKVLGHAEIRQTFKASGVGTIAGSYVLDGTFQRGCSVRITRNADLIFEGALASLKRFKDDVKEVKAGFECGLVFEKFNDVQVEDRVEAYTMVEIPR